LSNYFHSQILPVQLSPISVRYPADGPLNLAPKLGLIKTNAGFFSKVLKQLIIVNLQRG